MTLDEVTSVVEQAQALGLESVKFLGHGELLMNPELFRILNFFEERNIVIGIFTKAALLGNDKLAMQYQRMSSRGACESSPRISTPTFMLAVIRSIRASKTWPSRRTSESSPRVQCL